jgi:sugar fermentation stimulation protein A
VFGPDDYIAGIMLFKIGLIHGKLIRRYKRFLADVLLDDGNMITAHCTNSGSMKSCLENGADVWLSPSVRAGRKTPYTWEMILINGDWVGINTSNPNLLAMEWVLEGRIPGLENLVNLRREVKWEDSRFDLCGEGPGGTCFIEVKNVTLREGDLALFPDAVTERGRKHLHTLIRVKEAGMRAVMLYIVQRSDVCCFAPAREIDPSYAASLEEAVRQGVEIMVAQARVTPQGIEFHRMLPVRL